MERGRFRKYFIIAIIISYFSRTFLFLLWNIDEIWKIMQKNFYCYVSSSNAFEACRSEKKKALVLNLFYMTSFNNY